MPEIKDPTLTASAFEAGDKAIVERGAGGGAALRKVILGDAATKTVGTSTGQLVAVGADGKIASSLIPAGVGGGTGTIDGSGTTGSLAVWTNTTTIGEISPGVEGQILTSVDGAWVAAPPAVAASGFIRPEDYSGADAAKLNSAFAAGIAANKPVLLSANYSISTALAPITLAAGQRLHVIGEGKITATANIDPLLIEAAWGGTQTPTSVTATTRSFPGTSTVATDCHVIVRSGHGLAVGDVIFNWSDDVLENASATGDGSLARRCGEFAYVGDVSGDSVYLSGPLRETYTTAIRFAKVPTDARLIWDGPGFDSTAGQAWTMEMLTVRGLYQPFVRANFENVGNIGLNVQTCLAATIDVTGRRGRNRTQSETISGYLVQDTNSQQTTGRARGTDFRHVYTTITNSSATGAAGYLHGRTRGAAVDVVADSCSAAAVDTHGDAENCEFTVTARGGVFGEDSSGSAGQLRGRNNRILSMTAENTPHGMQFYSENAGGCDNCDVTDANVVTKGDGLRVAGSTTDALVTAARATRVKWICDNQRSGFFQNCARVIIEDAVIAPDTATETAWGFTLNGNAAVTFKRLTIDLTNFAGDTFDGFLFGAATTGNVLTVEGLEVVDPGEKLRALVNANSAGGTISVTGIAPGVTPSSADAINATSITAPVFVRRTDTATGITEAILAADKTLAGSLIAHGAGTVAALPQTAPIFNDAAQPVMTSPLGWRQWLDLEIGTDVQGYSASLANLAGAWTPASASGPASLIFLEDTDNGANKLTLVGPASLASDVVVTLPAATTTLLGASVTATLTVGYTATPFAHGTITSGTVSLSFANGQYQTMTLNGSGVTIAAPSTGEGILTLQITMGASAGIPTISSVTKTLTIDALTATNTRVYRLVFERIGTITELSIRRVDA